MTNVNIEQTNKRDEKEDVTYSIGQWFVVNDELCVLTQTGYGEVNLIGVSRGNRFSDPVKVNNIYEIPKYVIENMFPDEEVDDWSLVSSVDIKYTV